jgi:hypothetical protein
MYNSSNKVYHKFIQHLRFIDVNHISSTYGQCIFVVTFLDETMLDSIWNMLDCEIVFCMHLCSQIWFDQQPFFHLFSFLPLSHFSLFESLWIIFPGSTLHFFFPSGLCPVPAAPSLFPPPPHLRVGTLQAVQRVCCLLGWHGKLCSTK